MEEDRHVQVCDKRGSLGGLVHVEGRDQENNPGEVWPSEWLPFREISQSAGGSQLLRKLCFLRAKVSQDFAKDFVPSLAIILLFGTVLSNIPTFVMYLYKHYV